MFSHSAYKVHALHTTLSVTPATGFIVHAPHLHSAETWVYGVLYEIAQVAGGCSKCSNIIVGLSTVLMQSQETPAKCLPSCIVPSYPFRPAQLCAQALQGRSGGCLGHQRLRAAGKWLHCVRNQPWPSSGPRGHSCVRHCSSWMALPCNHNLWR